MLSKTQTDTKEHGYLVAVEVAEDTDVTIVLNRLYDSLQHIEGCGNVDIEYLGILDTNANKEIL